MLNSSIRPRTRSLTRGCVTPKSRAARLCVKPCSLMSWPIASMSRERTNRCSASPGGNPRSAKTFPDEGVRRASSPVSAALTVVDFREGRRGRASELAPRPGSVGPSFGSSSRTRGARTPLRGTLRRTTPDVRLRRESVSRIRQLLCHSSAASPRARRQTVRARADGRRRAAPLAERLVFLAANVRPRIEASRRLYKILYGHVRPK